MLEKDTPLYLFERDLFSLKKKYFGQHMTDELWEQAIADGDRIIEKYKQHKQFAEYIDFQIVTAINFMKEFAK